jgi:hypothetical protein
MTVHNGGSLAGNMRAGIALLLTLGFMAFCSATLWTFSRDTTNDTLRDVLLVVVGSFGAAFNGAIGYYFGARTASTAVQHD